MQNYNENYKDIISGGPRSQAARAAAHGTSILSSQGRLTLGDGESVECSHGEEFACTLASSDLIILTDLESRVSTRKVELG